MGSVNRHSPVYVSHAGMSNETVRDFGGKALDCAIPACSPAEVTLAAGHVLFTPTARFWIYQGPVRDVIVKWS
jgi:hypothetical protein